MIGDLNSFVQFMAAIYLTLTIDSLLFKRYWSPAYYDMVTKQLELYKFKSNQHLDQKLQDTIRDREGVITTTARKRGAVLLITCLTTLIFASFELPIPGEKSSPEEVAAYMNQYICLDLYLYLTIIVFIVFMYWMVNFLVVLVVATLLPLVFLLNFSPALLAHLQFLQFCPDTRILLVIVLLLPIVYQITVNWLYSDVYRKLLIRNLNNVRKDYISAKTAFEKEDATLLPESYKDIAAEFGVRHVKGDEQVTLLYQHLYKVLGDVCIAPRLRSLIGQIFKKEEEVFVVEQNVFPIKNEDQPVGSEPTTKDNVGIADKPQPASKQVRQKKTGTVKKSNNSQTKKGKKR